MPRRPLLAIALLAAILHGAGIARSSLPAQDGLKFLRVARAFHARPWAEVIRGTDQHPLYPACIAGMQPIVAPIAGGGADSWRISAQIVSALASILVLIPIYALTRVLFDDATAAMAALLFVLLPLPAEVGRDTLCDPLALLAFASAMALGEAALRSRRLAPAIGCGVASGLGYLARPEVAIAPLAVLAVGAISCLRPPIPLRIGWFSGWPGSRLRDPGPRATREGWCLAFETSAPRKAGPQARHRKGDDLRFLSRRLAPLSVTFLALVGAYAVVKGEVSEKLALRRAAAISSAHDAPSKTSRPLPPGLDSPRWDFSAKEESGHPGRLPLAAAAGRLLLRWCEAMGVILVPMAALGFCLSGRRRWGLPSAYAAVFSVILIRHATTFGYLSSRHTLSLVVAALPFAARGLLACVRGVAAWREARSPGSVANSPLPRLAAVAAMIAIGVGVQLHRRPHPSRWGHEQAGRWIAAHADEGDATLDTRGWASFVSGRSAHDYWHVRQALTDRKLAYVVVGEDERTASSPRGETLRAVLAYAAEPAAEFPGREGGRDVGVRVYRFHPPADWRGIDR